MSDVRAAARSAAKVEFLAVQAASLAAKRRELQLIFMHMYDESLREELSLIENRGAQRLYRQLLATGDDMAARENAAIVLVDFLLEIGRRNCAEIMEEQSAFGTELINQDRGLHRV